MQQQADVEQCVLMLSLFIEMLQGASVCGGAIDSCDKMIKILYFSGTGSAVDAVPPSYGSVTLPMKSGTLAASLHSTRTKGCRAEKAL